MEEQPQKITCEEQVIITALQDIFLKLLSIVFSLPNSTGNLPKKKCLVLRNKSDTNIKNEHHAENVTLQENMKNEAEKMNFCH